MHVLIRVVYLVNVIEEDQNLLQNLVEDLVRILNIIRKSLATTSVVLSIVCIVGVHGHPVADVAQMDNNSLRV